MQICCVIRLARQWRPRKCGTAKEKRMATLTVAQALEMARREIVAGEAEQAEQVQRLGLMRVSPENGPVDVLGLCQVAGPMLPHRHLQRLGHCEGRHPLLLRSSALPWPPLTCQSNYATYLHNSFHCVRLRNQEERQAEKT